MGGGIFYVQAHLSAGRAGAPVDAQLIELPAPVATETIEPEPPAAVEQPKPPAPVVLPPQVPVKPKVSPRTRQKPVVQKAKVLTSASDVPGNALTAPIEDAPATENTSSNNDSGTGSYDPKGPTRGNQSANSGARAIVQLMPKIPEDLRAEAFESQRWRASILPSMAAQRWNSPNRLPFRVSIEYCWIASSSGGLCPR